MGYAGAGATLGPNVVFGYQAGRHASDAAAERTAGESPV
jgi:hypothetical protein